VAGEHFARDLRVPRFVGAHQSKTSQPEEKQERAETCQRRPFGPGDALRAAGGSSGGVDYVLLDTAMTVLTRTILPMRAATTMRARPNASK
jgi:hypothetical protein